MTAATPDPWQVITDVMSELLRGGQTADIRCRAALSVLASAGIDFDGDPVAAVVAQEPKPAPELAAAMRETRQLRNIIGTLIDLFDEPDHRNMRHASVTKSTLTRYAAEAGVKP